MTKDALDPRERFSATVSDYRRFRPDYPQALLDWIVETGRLSAGDIVVDVGCGTGISSRQLAAFGLRVIGVDPNATMLSAAREQGGDIDYRQGEGESLPLREEELGAVAAIVGGQSFHWLDLERAWPHWRACLTSDGVVVPFWNLRDHQQPFMASYEALLCKHCPDYKRVGAEPRARAIMASPPWSEGDRHEVPHHQDLDRDAFHGRVWSSSYVRHGLVDREAFEDALTQLFDAHQREGIVRFTYLATAVIGR